MKKEVVDRFVLKLDELNDISTKIALADNAKKAVEMFEDTLISAYVEGFIGAKYIFGDTSLSLKEYQMRDALSKDYDGVTIQERLIDHYKRGRLGEIKNLVESEFHRVYTTAQLNGAEELGAKSKTWVTVGDDKVRETHAYLEGQTIPIDELFYTIDGDSALSPGDFYLAGNNANCRCILDFTE